MEPATEAVLGKLPIATPDDIEKAMQAAHRTFPEWRRTPALERATILRKAATALRARTAVIAPIIARELGKPLPESRIEIATAAEMF